MREGWEIKTIGEVCEIRSGRNQKEVENPNGKYPIYGSGGIMGYADDYLCEAGTTIIGRKGSINNPIFVETKFWNVDTAFGFSPKATILPKFLFYFCKGFNFQGMNKGTTIPSLVKTDLLQIRIPVPSIPEQQRIVDILDREFVKIDALKSNAEKSLQAVKDLFQATLKKELEPKEGWTYLRLNDIYNFIDYRGSTPTKLTEGIPLITAKNIKMGYLDYSIKDFISPEEYEHRQSRGVSHRGDILFTTEAPLGNIAIADKDVFSAGQRVITFQQYPNSTKQLNNRFYLYYFLSPSFQETLKEQATGATAQGIKASRLKEIKAPLVDIRIQKSITERLDELNEKCGTLQRNYQKTLSLCDDLKLSLLRKAFNGEL